MPVNNDSTQQIATRVPTLLIGIGGIGGEILRKVDTSLSNKDKRYVKMLVMDTNTNDLSYSINQNIPIIQTSENKTVSKYLQQNRSFLEWFPVNPLINSKNLTQGAGQIRSVSRLGALASEEAHRFDKIKDAILDISTHHGETLTEMIRIMIVGSVCGGTGSGLAIQLPFYIREVIENTAHMPKIIIRGLFIMPELLEEVNDTNEKKSALYVNAYAFLRELNAFYRAQTGNDGTEKISIEHYNKSGVSFRDDPTVAAEQVPYDFLFLIEQSNNEGRNIGKLKSYITKSAEIVKSQLFARSVSSRVYSTEDNTIVNQVKSNGLRRFCGAGVSKLIYPEDENIRYCTLKYSESLLSKYWLQIDNIVATNVSLHKRQMASDQSLEPLDPQKEYRAVFDDLTDATEHSVPLQYGLLKRELRAKVTTTDENGEKTVTEVDHAQNLLDSILEFTEGMIESDKDLTEMGDDCNPDPSFLSDPDKVSGHVNQKLLKLREFEEEANKKVGSFASSCTEKIFPSTLDIAERYEDYSGNPQNIYAALADKHPIVARYILYFLKEELSNKLEIIKASIDLERKSDDVFNTDYFDDKTGDKQAVEDPAEAFLKVKPGALWRMNIYSSAYSALVRNTKIDIPAYVEKVKKLAGYKLNVLVFSFVLKRIDIMIAQYELFFNNLEAVQNQRRIERENLEDNLQRIRQSDVYVCCDKVCKNWLYDKFEENLIDDTDTLSAEIKKEFFDTMYREYSKKLEATSSKTALKKKELNAVQLFEEAIINPMIAKFKKKEFLHINMNIIQAVNLEYDIHISNDCLVVDNNVVTDEDYSAEGYFEALANQIRSLSSPYLTYSDTSEEVTQMLVNTRGGAEADDSVGKVMVYYGINADVAAEWQNTDLKHLDHDLLNSKFGNPGNDTMSAVDDNTFDSKEITCYSSIYDFSIENLDKYRPGSKSEGEYMDRLLTIYDHSYRVGTGEDAYLRTVHPHLDKNWHKHSYLPMLNIDQEVKECGRIRLGFLLAVATNRCRYREDDFVRRWTFRRDGEWRFETLNLDNEAAKKASYYTLYQTLDENPLVIIQLNDMNKNAITEAYNGVRINGINLNKLDELFAQPIIKGFIGRELSEDESKDFETAFENNTVKKDMPPLNILDVIYSLYLDSADITLAENIINTLSDYLRKYCLKMAKDQPGLGQKLFEATAKKIGDNFSMRGKNELNDDFRYLCHDYI